MHAQPAQHRETFSTLQFATRCAHVHTAPVLSSAASGTGAAGAADGAALRALQAELEAVKDELEETHSHYQKQLEEATGGAWMREPGPASTRPLLSLIHI